MPAMTGQILPGLADPVHDAQQVFRDILDATAQPGRIVTLRRPPGGIPPGLSPAATAVCLTLLDFETSLWLDEPSAAVRDYLVFHCGCPIAAARKEADFVLLRRPSAMPAISDFAIGTDEHPERGATLVIEVSGFANHGGGLLRGPGIADAVTLRVDGIPAAFWHQVADNHALFPCGVDLILTHAQRLVALPRSVRVEG